MHREMPLGVLLSQVLLWVGWAFLAALTLTAPYPDGGLREFVGSNLGALLGLGVFFIANVGALLGRSWARSVLAGCFALGLVIIAVAFGSGAASPRGLGRLAVFALVLGGLAVYIMFSEPVTSWYASRQRESAP